MVFDALLDSHCVVCRSPGALLCPSCHRETVSAPHTSGTLDGVPVLALGVYAGALRQVIRAAKNYRSRSVMRVLRGDLFQLAVEHLGPSIVSVPASRPGHLRRGYGLADVMAQILGRHERNALRLVDSGTQRGRTAHARSHSRQFDVRRGLPPRVILVDDVITTGATVRSAIEALRKANCDVVAVIALAVVTRAPTR